MEERERGYVYFSLDPKDTNYINRIIEGYEYVGVMSTVDREKGLAVIRCTEDTKHLAIEILRSLPEVKEIFK